MWKEYNPNPTGRRVEDCSVRAVAKALGISWEDAFALLSKNAYQMGDMAHSNSVIGSVLRMHGFYRRAIPNTCPDCYTAEDFLEDHPRGTFVLFFGNHVATGKDGILFDTWDSSGLSPQYVWFRPQEV